MRKKIAKKNKVTTTGTPPAEKLKILLISVISYLLLFWLFPVYSFIGLYAVVGIMIGALNDKPKENIVLGMIAGAFAGILSSIFLRTENFIYYAQTMPNSIVNRDIPMNLYTEIFFGLASKNPISYLGIPLYILISIMCITFFSVIFSSASFRKIGTYVFIFILCANFLFISIISSKGITEYASVEPANYSYGYDALYYLKTAYVLEKEPFYKAFMIGVKYDSRTPPDYVVNDQWRISSTLHIRQPFIFYVWKFVGQGNLGRVIYLSIAFCAFLLVLSFYSAKQVIGKYSFFAPVAILPFLFTGTTWANVFFPDWWAGLFFLAGVLFWLLKKYWPSSLFFLIALMSRGEVTMIIFFIFLFYAFLKKREARKPFLLAALIFFLWFGVHYYRAGFHVQSISRGSLIASLIEKKFDYTSSAAYMMFLYGYFKIPVFLITIISIVGSVIKRYYEFTILAAYSFFHYGFHSSTYWGQHLALVLILSSTFIFSIKWNDMVDYLQGIKSKFRKVVIEKK